MKSDEIRLRFLKFFEARGHKIIPSSSFVPENDPSVLFTTAGMQQFKEYYTHPKDAKKDFGSLNVTTIQKCIRTGDIDEVGNPTHLTFFEMLGNWSLGDYWKKEAIEWSYEFLTDKKWLGVDKNKIYISVFKGDGDAPKDEELAKSWQSLGIPKDRIFFFPKKDNWWGPAGKTGPCG